MAQGRTPTAAFGQALTTARRLLKRGQRRLVVALSLLGIVELAALLFVIAPAAGAFGYDAYAYWSVDLQNLYGRSAGDLGVFGAFRYAPAVGQLFSLFGLVPWNVFLAAWSALILGAVAWMGRRWALVWLAFPPVISELYYGNVHVLMAAAIVLGFRYPPTWSFVILTKVSPGIGLLWFLIRREWRSLALALGATAAIVALSFAVMPSAWREWIDVTIGNRVVYYDNVIPIPLVARLPFALALVVWGALTGRRWTVVVASCLALPVLGYHGLSMLVAVSALTAAAPAVDLSRFRRRHEPRERNAAVKGPDLA